MAYPELTYRYPTELNGLQSEARPQIILDWSVDLDTTQVSDAATLADLFILMEDVTSTIIPLTYVSYTAVRHELILAPSTNLKSNYTYRIIIKDKIRFTDGRRSANSYNWIFKTAPSVIEAAILLAPGNTTIQPIFPSLSWNAVSATGTVVYEVQIDDRFDFGSIDYSTSTTAVSITPAGSFSDETTYYWRVRATNSTASGDWSDTWSFRYGREINSDVTSRQNYPDINIFDISRTGFKDGASNMQVWPTISFTFTTVPGSDFADHITVLGKQIIPRDDKPETYLEVAVGGSWSLSNKTITFTPTDELANNCRYEITIYGDMTDVNGYRLVDDYNYYFTGKYKPYYVDIRAIRAKFLSSQQHIPDDLINYYIYEAGLEANARFYGYLQVANVAGFMGDALKENIVRDSKDLNSFGVQKWVESAATYNLLKAILHENTTLVGRSTKLGDASVSLTGDFVTAMKEAFHRAEQELEYWESFLIPSHVPMSVSKNSAWSPRLLGVDWSLADNEAGRTDMYPWKPRYR